MRRLVVLVALVSVTCLGFGSVLVLAGSKAGTPGTGQITICHEEGNGSFHEVSVDASTIVAGSGHGGHPGDIIPPFYYVESGVEKFYPGMNMDRLYGDGYTGAEVLANHCVVPSGGTTGTTETTVTTGTTEVGTTVTVTTTVPQPTTVTVTVPGTTVTVPPETITHAVTITVTIPAVTVTTPGTTTVVTVGAGSTTTVTLPTQTVTLPATTQTVAGETIEHPPLTVTQPGTTRTITAGAATTVVTVTGPTKTVESGVLGEKAIVVTVTGPAHTVQLPPHIFKEVVKAKALARRIFVSLIRACQPAIGSGKG